MDRKTRKIFKELKNNYKIIVKTYELLEETSKNDIPPHSAGIWLLDNMYIIEQQYRDILMQKSNLKDSRLTVVKFQEKRQITTYKIANDLVEKNKGNVDEAVIHAALIEYQKDSILTTDEICLFPLMVKICIIKFICKIAVNISNSQIQKIRVNNILKNDINLKGKNNVEKISRLFVTELKTFKEDKEIQEKLKYTNTAFVEYLASLLKQNGSEYDYVYDILNEEAEKVGFTVEEAIVREHMEIAKTTDYIGRAINSLKQVDALNLIKIFEDVNKIDEILKEDYTEEFTLCDYKTKDRYRNRIIYLSKKHKLSEIYVAKQAVECSHTHKKHIGFFLSGEEKYILNRKLKASYLSELIFNKYIKPTKPYIYVLGMIIVALMATILLDLTFVKTSNMVFHAIFSIASFFLMFEIVEKTVNFFVRKIVPPKILPRFDFAKTIPKKYSTYVVTPAVITSFEKIDTMISKMETTYLANRSENMYYMILGDCTSSTKKTLKIDEEYINYAREKLDVLNEKYKSSHKLFNFMYRKRIYNKHDKCYMGWERKRGAIEHFNRLVLGKLTKEEQNEYMYLAYDDIVKTKYAITIDEDTALSLNTAKDLVSIIAHPLNKPKLSKNGKYVKSGHALIQPGVSLDIESANQSIFAKIFGGFGGLDMYTTAVSNTYQDLFNEAIYCGKGIYDIEMFETILKDEVPENLVLSHDLLEGSYLRAGLASDIQVQDDFPSNYISYMKRNHRWYRGDVQIIKWLLPKSPLNFLSKWKIFDNIRRPLTMVIGFFVILLSLIFMPNLFIYTSLLVFLCINFGYILGIIDNLLFGKKNIYSRNLLYIPIINGLGANLLNMTFEFITMPYTTFIFLDASFKSLYRMCISKKKMLEWTTADALAKMSKNNIEYYYMNMLVNVVTAMVIIAIITIAPINYNIKVVSYFMGVFFLCAPLIAFLTGKNYLFKRKTSLNKDENLEILEVAKRTWTFFDFLMTPVNNYLVSDNYQQNRRVKIANRTSSTNIGMQLLAIMNAYDLKFITDKDCLLRLDSVIGTIKKLEKWNGHLYNWYNIKTLEPLRPRFVSTVDSGNFIACMYVVKEFLTEIDIDSKLYNKNVHIINKLIRNVEETIDNTDFTKLYNKSRNLFSIGFALEENRLVDSYYDMLMSENRTTSFVAIASKQVTSKHWFALSRKMVKVDGYKGLTSWSGTAFEYYMPQIFMKSYEHTLIDESLFFAKYLQQKIFKKLGIPWGISEAAYYAMDNELNYQYKAFGLDKLGLKRGLKDYTVVAPYASILMISENPKDVYNNLNKLKKIGAYSSFGFYESVDYTKAHMVNNEFEIIKTYMAHHQGMILASINNYLNKDIIKNRFHNIPEFKATEILLKERERMKVDMKKDSSAYKNDEKNELKNKYSMFVSNKYVAQEHVKLKNKEVDIALLRGKDTSTILTSSGATYFKFKNKIVNKQRYKDMKGSLNSLVIIDKHTMKSYDVGNIEKISEDKSINVSNFYAALNSVEYSIHTDDLEITNNVFLSPEISADIRKVSIFNDSTTKREIEIVTYIEPALTDYMTSVVHPSFNNLQIETHYDEILDSIIASKRLKNEHDTELFMYSKLLGIDLPKEVETEKNKLGTENEFDSNVSKYPLWPVLSYKAKIILDPYEKQSFYYVVGVEESKYKLTNTITNLTIEQVNKEHKLSAELNTIMSRYLKLKDNEALAYNKILHSMLFENKVIDSANYWDTSISQSMLWKYSISGDLPILLINITSVEHLGMIDNVLEFVDYVKNRNLDIDVIIIASDDNYSSKVHSFVSKKVENTSFINYTKGNIYVFNLEDLSIDDIKLFKFVAKKEISEVDEFLPQYYMNTTEKEEISTKG